MQTELFKGGEKVTVWLRDQSGTTVSGTVCASDAAAVRLIIDKDALGDVVIPWSNIAVVNCEGSTVATGITDYRTST